MQVYLKFMLLCLVWIWAFVPNLRIQFPGTPLAGSILDVPAPKFTLDNFLEGKYQLVFEDWFADRQAFKDLMIRTENTLNLTVFREISTPRKSNPIILGRDYFLFEKSYINNFNGVSEIKGDMPYPAPQSIDETCIRLGFAAKVFKKLGINFAVFFYPHKAWIMPEKLDPKWILPEGHNRAVAGYQSLLSALRKCEVPVVDGAAIFAELAAQQPNIRLYPRGGTHWTTTGACHALNGIIDVMRPQTARYLPNLSCESEAKPAAHPREMDIASLVNVWDESVFNDQIPVVKPKILGANLKEQIHYFYEGTSFSGELYDLLANTSYSAPNAPLPNVYYRRGGVPAAFNWDKDIFSNDWILLEQSQGSFVSINTMEWLEDLETNSLVYQQEVKKMTGGRH